MPTIDFTSAYRFNPNNVLIGLSDNFLGELGFFGPGYTVFDSTSARWVVQFSSPIQGISYVGFYATTSFSNHPLGLVAPAGVIDTIVLYSSTGAIAHVFDHLDELGFSISQYVGDPTRLVSGGDDYLGSTGDDMLYAGAGADFLDGDAGNDTLHGEADNDILLGAAGADSLYGEAGDDSIAGEDGDDHLVGGDGADVLTGGAGNDNLDGTDGDDHLDGGADNDYLDGSGGDDYLDGGAGNDSLYGLLGYDTASYASATSGVTVSLALPGAAQNTIGAGIDTFQGIDAIEGSNFDDHLTGSNVLAGTLWGMGGNDVLTGKDAAEKLYGGAGDDVINAGNGNDLLSGGAGADALDGGGGVDTASYADSGAGVTINLATAFAAGGDAEGDAIASIENLIGSAFADALTGDANANTLAGGAGADALDGGGGNDTADYTTSADGVLVNLATGTVAGGDADGDTLASIENLIGSAFADSLRGDTGANSLAGGDGDDTLAGGAGADALDGGAGVNTADYSASSAAVAIDLTAAVASGGDADGDTLVNIQNVVGSAFADTLIGDANANALTGGSGDDFLSGAGGADALDGGLGTDTADYSASTAGVTINLQTGASASGDAQGDTLTSIENLVGSAFVDSLSGSDVGNVLFGGAGADTLLGGNGDDMLIGGGGADVLGGGAGVDTADYSTSSAAVTVNLQTALGSGGDAQGDAYASIENITGSAFDDVLTGRNGFANVLDGSDGNDLIAGGQGADTLIGGNGVDTLDYSNSFNGVDIRLFQNTAAGGDANGDSISGFENIIGSTKTDTLAGDDGVNVISGGAGNETITGRDGGDHLSGDGGNDTLLGGNGDDVLIGGAGNDTLGGGTGNDTADYSASGAAINVSLQTGAGSGGDAQGDTLVSIENMIGSAFADIIAGKNNWDNVLDGGAGSDTLSGGTGNDTFVFHANDANGDTVLDFSHTGAGNHDTLEFDGYGTAAQGANLVQIDATHWQINSADGSIHDTLIIANAVVLTSGDYIFGGG